MGKKLRTNIYSSKYFQSSSGSLGGRYTRERTLTDVVIPGKCIPDPEEMDSRGNDYETMKQEVRVSPNVEGTRR